MTENIIKTVKIKRIINECEDVKTFIVKTRDRPMPKPGQFVMVWVPGIDEVPMSLSGFDHKGTWSLTVKDVGECTNALHKLMINDYIGVRGPLGNHFPIPEKDRHIFLVGGGIGLAPLKSLALDLFQKKIGFTLIEGAKIHHDIIYMDEFRMYQRDDTQFLYCTDDGSYGDKGFSTELFEQCIEDFSRHDLQKTVVYTCGPEVMMKKLFSICEKLEIELYASLERIMRCGCGLCGLCAVDPVGLLVCKDGPIFDRHTLAQIDDFGKYARDFTGKKIPLK